MQIKAGETEFDWDAGNLYKSYQKHGVKPEEAEEVFEDKNLIILPDIKHTQPEPRYIAVGKSLLGRTLLVVFTARRDKIRIISVRRMHKKEVAKYEEIKKNTQF